MDADGDLLVGRTASAASAFGNEPNVQITSAGGVQPLALVRHSANAFGPTLALDKSRNATDGAHTVVQSGDTLGEIYVSGSDGTAFIPGARIAVESDGTPGTNDMPGRITFSTTADGAAAVTERMRIDSAGRVGIGVTPSYTLDITTPAASATSSVARFRNLDVSATYNTDIYVNNSNVVGDLLLTRRANGEFWVYQSGAHSISLCTSATERMKIASSGLITGTGTSLGAWTAWTPTISGTGFAIGNGTIAGYAAKIGKFGFFRLDITFGSTSTYGAGPFAVSLPYTASSNQSAQTQFPALAYDASAAKEYLLHGQMANTASLVLRGFNGGANGEIGAVTSTVPITWATGDLIRLSGTYEIA